MKPEISMPTSIQERATNNSDFSNVSPDRYVQNGSSESLTSKSETASIASEMATLTTFPVPALQQAPLVNSVATPIQAPIDNNPAMASHVDIIEKEWVDRAKKIVDSTRDDPYQQEKAISELQIDYLKKRYGKDVDAAS